MEISTRKLEIGCRLLGVCVSCCVLFGILACAPALASEPEWLMLKGKHFLVYYVDNVEFAEKVGRKAEEYYSRIARDLAITRREDFWLWDNRVRIYIYPTREKFAEDLNAPGWAAGQATYETEKMIATFYGHDGFLTSILPHELAHLVFRDFVGFTGKIPLWLDEGIAQWEEEGKREETLLLARGLMSRNQLIPLTELMRLDIRQHTDGGFVAGFYAQSASLVGFLIEEHGAERFRKFCGSLRDGKDMDNALRFAYQDRIANIEQLEKAWRKRLADP